MRDKFVKIKSVFMEIMKRAEFVLNDTHGEFKFNVDGHEVTATFSEKRNDDLVPRLKEILVGTPVVRETPAEYSNKKPPKKKRDRDAR